MVAAWLLGGALRLHGASAEGTPPNIVVILTDDLDQAGLVTAATYILPGGQVLMPNLNSYLYNGSHATVFKNSFVSFSLCCPSRATLLTGQYAHNHGVLGNDNDHNGGCTAFQPHEASTLATWLQGPAPNGYYTGIMGKYMNGYGDDPQKPIDDCRNPRYVPPVGWDRWEVLAGSKIGGHIHWGNPQAQYGYVLNVDGDQEGPVHTYQTQKLSDDAVDFITGSPADQPFFLYVAPTAPHREAGQDPLCTDNIKEEATIRPYPQDDHLAESIPLPMPPSFSEADVSDKPYHVQQLPPYEPDPALQKRICTTDLYHDRLESLKAVDRLIGAVAVAQPPNTRPTVLFFTSDNGFYLGQHRAQSKELGYEEGIRVPLLVHDPRSACVANRKLTAPFAVNTDLAPTIAELAGVPTGPVDGQSFRPVLEPEAPYSCASPPQGRNRFLVEHWVNASCQYLENLP